MLVWLLDASLLVALWRQSVRSNHINLCWATTGNYWAKIFNYWKLLKINYSSLAFLYLITCVVMMMVSRNGGGGDGVEKEGRERGDDDDGPTRARDM